MSDSVLPHFSFSGTKRLQRWQRREGEYLNLKMFYQTAVSLMVFILFFVTLGRSGSKWHWTPRPPWPTWTPRRNHLPLIWECESQIKIAVEYEHANLTDKSQNHFLSVCRLMVPLAVLGLRSVFLQQNMVHSHFQIVLKLFIHAWMAAKGHGCF